jgi:hypothetical protein
MVIMDPFARLLEHATSAVPGLEANRALWDARAELETRFTNVVCYEMVVNENAAWSDFLATAIPRVTEHFNAKGLPMLGGPNAILAVWRDSKLFLFDSREFFDTIREIEELDENKFWLQIAEWRKALGLSVPREAVRAAKSPVHPSEALALAPVSSKDIVRNSDDVRISDESSEIRTDK